MKLKDMRFRDYLPFILIAIAFIWYFANNGDNNSTSKTYKPDPVLLRNTTYDGSVYCVKSYLKDALNDPKSYEPVNWGKVEKTTAVAGAQFRVYHSYRAKNGFGALVITEQVFYYNDDCNVVFVEDL